MNLTKDKNAIRDVINVLTKRKNNYYSNNRYELLSTLEFIENYVDSLKELSINTCFSLIFHDYIFLLDSKKISEFDFVLCVNSLYLTALNYYLLTLR